METYEFNGDKIKYLKLLARDYPCIINTKNRIVNLSAKLNLPKATEHFLTDIHGEDEAFTHVLKNASGQLKVRIEELFYEELTKEEMKKFATLIYYPIRKIEVMKKNGEESQVYDRYLPLMIRLAKNFAGKYTNKSIVKKINSDYKEVISNIIFYSEEDEDKNYYVKTLIRSMIENNFADEFIVELSNLIQKLAVDHLHIIGDIYDRGSGPHVVMNKLMEYHSVDVQWGNHDILWMGAGGGSMACIANVVRISTRYANLDVLEDGYGINLLPLAQFAQEFYGEDSCESFKAKVSEEDNFKAKDLRLINQMHKAISVIQFKLEGNLIKSSPEYELESRLLLDKININEGTITIGGKTYKLNDSNFPTVDWDNPYELTKDEEEVIEKLQRSFINSDNLQKHIRFLFSKGGIYLIHNGNLLYHGCIPLDENGELLEVDINGKAYSGKSLLDFFDQAARKAFYSKGEQNDSFGADLMWYLWLGKHSPLFGKDQMTTFERYFIDEKESHHEEKNQYFLLRDTEKLCDKILKEFGLDSSVSRIVNGHVPVKAKKGENPIKANGKLFVIDGGFAKAYQKETGLAGYTLVSNSYGLQLIEHQPFESIDKAIRNEEDILSVQRVVEKADRKCIRDTDEGKRIKREISDLKDLLFAYKKGIIKEKRIDY